MVRILIVDDDEPSRCVVRCAVEGMGSLGEATNGFQAVEKFKAALDIDAPYNVVFLDIMMPGLGGIDVLKNMRSLERIYGSRALIYMMTAVAEKEYVTSAYSGDCDGYLVKPIAPKTYREKCMGVF